MRMLQITIASLLSLTLAMSCGASTKPPPLQPLPTIVSDELGPFGVGVTTRGLPPVTGGDHPQPFDVEIWYPVDADAAWRAAVGDRTPYSGLNGFALRDWPIAVGYERFPLIVFAHGLAAIREQSNFQVQYLVSRGYVVVSADHHPSLLWESLNSDQRKLNIVRSAINRPLEVVAEIDAFERWRDDPADALFFDRVSTTRVVAMGHSFGGYTALSVSGARARFDVLVKQCEEIPAYAGNINCDIAEVVQQCERDPASVRDFDCAVVDEYDGVARDFAYPDTRVAGIVPMTPGATPLFADGGLSEARVPMLLWGGSEDDLIDPALFLDWVYDDWPTTKLYANVPGAAHLDFSQVCQGGLPFGCGLDGPYDAPETLRLINDLTAAFVDWVLRDDLAARDRLTVDAVASRYPQLSYRAAF